MYSDEVLVIGVKGVTAIVTFSVSMVGGYLALRSADAKWAPLLTVFAAGVFLGTAMGHIMPDAAELTEPLSDMLHFPVSQAITGLAVILTLFLERITTAVIESNERRVAPGHIAVPPSGAHYGSVMMNPALIHDGVEWQQGDTREYLVPIAEVAAPPPVAPASSASLASPTKIAKSTASKRRGRNVAGGATDDVDVEGPAERLLAPTGSSAGQVAPAGLTIETDPPHTSVLAYGDDEAVHGSGGHSHAHAIPSSVSSATAIVLFVALSFHSIMEGIAVGLSTSHAALYGLLIALLSHKVVDTFSLGAVIVAAAKSSGSLYSASFKTHFFVQIAAFSLSTPIGILIGTALGHSLPAAASGCVLSATAGTFLYVALVEMIAKEFESSVSVSKCAAIVAGYVFMIGLALFV